MLMCCFSASCFSVDITRESTPRRLKFTVVDIDTSTENRFDIILWYRTGFLSNAMNNIDYITNALIHALIKAPGKIPKNSRDKQLAEKTIVAVRGSFTGVGSMASSKYITLIIRK